MRIRVTKFSWIRRRAGTLAFVSGLARNRSGVAAIEYALAASLIALAVIVAIGNLGVGVEEQWNGVAENVAGR